ncbi:MAG: MmgE/PrpD family protein [Peptococcaceae bacterium]
MGLVRVLANYVVETDFAHLPSEVVEQAKKALLDCTGNMIGGRYTNKGEAIIKYILEKNNLAEATVIGSGKTSREMAAFANGVMSRVLDLDDGHRFAFGHPGGVIIPTGLAIGEFTGASGSDVIAAFVIGYDVYARLGSVINPSSYHERGFDATGVCGAVAAAAVAAKLYKLDVEKTKDALGIAALQAGGIIEYQTDGTMGKVLCPAWSASTGIRAAELAKLGFTGPETVLEGSKGFFQAFAKKYDPSRLTAELGSKYGILQNYFKIHACMRGLHCAIDALLSICAEHALSVHEVKEITIKTSTFVNRLNRPHPQTLVGAQCSLPFTIAAALKYGCVSEAVLTKSINDQEISEIEEKINVVVDQKIQDYAVTNPDNWTAVELEVITTDGKKLSQWSPIALGEPERPLAWEALQEKFCHLVTATEFEPLIEVITTSIKQFDGYQTIGDFNASLNPLDKQRGELC